MISPQGARSRVASLLTKFAKNITPNGYHDLGKQELPANSPRALVIYTIHYLHKVLFKQDVDKAWLNSHSGFWESLQMLKLLNEAGYIVDYYDTWNDDLKIEWDKYDLVIDERNNLQYCTSARPVKVFYCTGVYWLRQNLGELRRTEAFLRRTGIKTIAKRQLKSLVSDSYADLQTHFGSDTQLQYFTPKHGFVPLDISCVTVPEVVSKNIQIARTHFVWFGGAGMLHKGADLAIEAFATMPNVTLHIMGGIHEDLALEQWLAQMQSKYPNIKFEGWMNTESTRFQELVTDAIGVLLPSASEGGPTSVPQAMHFGLLPIVTETANLRCPLGYVIREEDPDAIITGIREAVQSILTRSDDDLRTESEACRAFAQQRFTRDAYSRSFRALLARVEQVRQLRSQEQIN